MASKRKSKIYQVTQKHQVLQLPGMLEIPAESNSLTEPYVVEPLKEASKEWNQMSVLSKDCEHVISNWTRVNVNAFNYWNRQMISFLEEASSVKTIEDLFRFQMVWTTKYVFENTKWVQQFSKILFNN
jgi:hypothetical protein